MTSPYHFRINRSHIATVTAYLKDEVNGRKRYFKAKHIAKDIGLKTGQVAGVMRWMLVNPSEFKNRMLKEEREETADATRQHRTTDP